jgi:hypothetical protein
VLRRVIVAAQPGSSGYARRMREAVVTATQVIVATVLVSLLAPAIAAAQELRPLGPLDAHGTVTYFIAAGPPSSGYVDADRDLATWALGDWERAAHGKLHFVPGEEASALVRIYWVEPGGGQYGETRAIEVNGRRGAAVFVRPDTDALGPDIATLARADPLFRDTIVYLTCVHELGHALGLRHTATFADVMYFFGFGGDIPRFFKRYREQLGERADIPHVSGLSKGDLTQLDALYAPNGARGGSSTVQALAPRPLTSDFEIDDLGRMAGLLASIRGAR